MSGNSRRGFSALLILALLATSLGGFNSEAKAATSIFINEIHYDNTGSDTGEAIEIAGPADTDLTGWSLVLYNGNGGVSYSTTVLSGTIANQNNGYGTLSFSISGIQNGAPDGIALVDTSSAVVQFLSYEGTFVAVGGPADGMTSTDIGVSESGNTTVGDSLQMVGTGVSDEDFTWANAAVSTFGAVNTGQIFSASEPSIVINEVDADQVGTDAAEFVELYDGGSGNTALDGLVVVFFNGSNDQSYTPALDLDGYSTNGDGYFVICGDAANVPNCDLDTSPNTNLIQNGADAVALYTGDAADFPNDTPVTTTDLMDAIVYDTNDSDDAGLSVLLNAGQPQVNEDGSTDSTIDSNQRCPDGTGGARNTVAYSQFPPTPGSTNTCSTSTGCGTPATLISAVQGPGIVSPLIGNTVTIEAIVTADFQESDELSGFFLQEEVSDYDSNPLTSEGIFVYSTSTDVAVGDLVHLTGTAGEYYEMTQINSVTDLEICSNNNTLPTVTSLLLPLGNAAALEIVEGMYVQYSLPLYVTETYNLGRYGEVWLSSISPLDTPTNVVEPGTDANLMEIANDLNRVLLDDFSQIQNPPTVPYLRPSNDTLRIGDTVTNLTGVINYSYSCYRLQPTTPVTFTPANARPGVPSVGGTLNVASFNVLNYFTTLGSRGANTMEEFACQRDKIIEAIIALDADVIGLMEIENNGYGTNSAIHNLVSGLNDSAGSSVYAFIDPGVTAIGSDEIAVGLIYKVDSVESVGLASILDSSVDPNFNSNKNRPVLAQTFRDLSNNGQFTVAVNHLKSKGSNCNNIGDPDTGDGQGNCNLTRTSAAAALVDWLATDPTGTSETDFLIIGDLNAYLQEDPINAIEVGADDIENTTDDYVDLVTQFAGNSIPYSYVYDGERGVLDHALASSPMQSQVTGVAHWHINADEPRILDYNTEYGQEALNLYVVDPFRSSDHDPVVIGLNLMPQTFVDLPLLMTKVFDVLQGEQVSFDPLLDLNPNGLAWVEESIRIVSGPLHGGAWVASIHYVPYASYLGDDTLTYQICDTSNQCWRVVVNYNVTAKALPDTGFAPGVKTEFDGVSNLQPLSANGISLSIPSLSVNAEVVGVPLSGDSWDVHRLSGQVGYLAGTAYPTWNGNTLLTAHIYDANGLPGPFHQLKSLKWGDVVQIDAYGLTYTYQVRQVYHWVSPTDAHAFQHEEMDWITLVTCQGYDSASNSYPWRTVVRAVLVSVE